MLESLKQNDGRQVYSFSGMLGMKGYIYVDTMTNAVTNALGNRATAAYEVPAVTTPTVSIGLNELLSTH